jgi:hypothetical protein
MSIKKSQIESFVESALDDFIYQAFQNEFTDINDIEYALEYLKLKINDLEADDFI